jgi:hypothetical protein
MPIIEVVQRIEVPDIPDIELPYDDGEPLETNWYRLQINLLGDMLHRHWPERTGFFAGGNMFIYCGWLWSGILQLWLGIQEGRFQGTSTNWLRFFTPAGTLVPSAEEAAESAHTRAETERARAETERARAEAEHARAEALEAENTRLRAELERLRGSTP